MNWFRLFTVSFLLCIYPTLDLPKLETTTEFIAQEKPEYIEATEIRSDTNIKFNFAATKPFKLKKNKEIL